MRKQNENSRLKILRLKYKLTQEELAQMAGIHRATVAKAECGNFISLQSALLLARVLGTTVEYLFLPIDAQNISKGGEKCG